MIRKEAWSFYRTTSGLRLYWELEDPKGPQGHVRPVAGSYHVRVKHSPGALKALPRKTNLPAECGSFPEETCAELVKVKTVKANGCS